MVYEIFVPGQPRHAFVEIPEGNLALGLPHQRLLSSQDVAYGLSYYRPSQLAFIALSVYDVSAPVGLTYGKLVCQVIGVAPPGSVPTPGFVPILQPDDQAAQGECCPDGGVNLSYVKTQLKESP